MTINQVFDSNLFTNSYITEDWYGGYKLEVDLSSDFNIQDWTVDFQLPGNIREVYGADLIDRGNGNYTLSGQNDWQSLEAGKVFKTILIVDDYGQNAVVPQFDSSNNSTTDRYSLMSEAISDPLPPSETDFSQSPSSPSQQFSSDVISVGFEGHSNNTTYDYSAQSKDWNVAWSTHMERYASISDREAHSGNNSLKIDYPANEQSNAGAKWEIPEQKEYYLSYWVKFDRNFDFDGDNLSGGKLPGLGEGQLASGGTKPDGNNGFTSRYMWRENGKATLYLYHMDMEDTYGDDILLKGEDGQDKYFERGQWHNMIQRVRVNDGGQANGEIDVWMDNEQVLDMDGLRLTNGQGVDTMFFSSFHGGNGSDWWPEQEVNAYFDDFVVSTNPTDVGL